MLSRYFKKVTPRPSFMRLRVIRPKTEFIKRKVCKISGLKTGGHHAVFSVLEVKRSNISQKLNKQDCFCLHSWLHFLWHVWEKNWFTQQIYDLTLCLAHFLKKIVY